MTGLSWWYRSLANTLWLTHKELRSLLGDLPLLVLMAFSFTFAVYLSAVGVKADVDNATVAIVDEDHSALSRRLPQTLRPPLFQPARQVSRAQAELLMDRGDATFVLVFPPRMEADLRAGRSVAVQLLVDATALTQAGLGTADLQQQLTQETARFFDLPPAQAQLPVRVQPRVLFNPNAESRWYSGVMQIIVNVTALTIILAGAAVMREREHGTLEHLLVMPVRPHEVALGKILANGLFIVAAVMASVLLVLHQVLGVPLPVPVGAHLGLLALGTALYVFAMAALGIWLATLTRSMPQFSLLSAPVYVVLYLISGAATPVESMPVLLQQIVRWVPSAQYAAVVQAVLYRGAGLAVVWQPLVAEFIFGALILSLALLRFRAMLARQG